MRNQTRVQSARVPTMRNAGMFLVTAISIFVLGTVDVSAAGQRAGNRGTMARSSVSGANINRGNVNTRNVNTGNINTGNINVNRNVNRNVNVNNNHYHGGGYWGGGVYHPVARAAAIGAIAVTTAAVVGSMFYALPPTGCSTVIMNGMTYSHCGSVYYQQTWSGNDVVYVVVNP